MVDNIISSLGGGSGIDTLKLVDDLISIERSVKDETLDTREKKLSSQISGYGALRSAMTGIQDSAKLLGDSDTFNARDVTFSDTALITPTDVEAGALPGDYSIEVVDLASAHSLSAGGFTGPNAQVGNGTLTFTFGDWATDHSTFTANADKSAQNLTIDASNNTLSGVRDAINDGDFGVQASIIQTGGAYTLQITSASGADNELQISVAEGVPAGLADLAYEGFPPAGGMTENNNGADASLKVNGLLVTRSSNQIDDVIEGLSFTLNAESAVGETATVSVTADKSYGEQVIRDFVETYNLFLDSVAELTKRTDVDPDAEDSTAGSLSADPTAKSMISQVRGIISKTVGGLSGNYNALATIGIQTELDGSISIDDDLLQQALDNNYAALTDLFSGTNSSTDAGVSVVKTKPTTATGDYDVVIGTQPAKGTVVGNGISAGDAAALGLNTATGSFGAGLDTNLGNYSFKVAIDGTTSNLITLSGNYADTDAFMADLQAQINGDAALSAVGAAADISYDSATESFSVTSRSYGSASQVSFSAISTDMGRFALGSSAGALTAGPIVDAGATDLDTSGSLTTTGAIDALATTLDVSDNFTIPLDASAGDYTFNISVDGAASALVTLSGTYATAADLGADLQAQINADANLVGAGASVTVGYDSVNDKYTFTSASSGSASTVDITSVGTDMVNLGIAAETGTAGVDDTFVTPLDTALGAYSFDIAVDGGVASTITLAGTYNTAEDVRAALETEITGVTVSYDDAANSFTFTSQTTGLASSVVISNPGADIANLGIGAATGSSGQAAASKSVGVDVSGTIDGVAAFGSGNILLPEIGSLLSGLSLEISPGTTSATISLSRGFATELNNILDSFLESKGLITDREARLNDKLDDVDTERTDLDRRMETRQAQLQSQFLAMERIIASLNSTSSSLDGLVDRLPFTAKS